MKEFEKWLSKKEIDLLTHPLFKQSQLEGFYRQMTKVGWKAALEWVRKMGEINTARNPFQCKNIWYEIEKELND